MKKQDLTEKKVEKQNGSIPEYRGSFTVEAACVMSVVLLSLAVFIGKAGQVHDETAAAMVLHEAVEKCRHEKNLRSQEAELFFRENKGLMLQFVDLHLSIQEKGEKRIGKVSGGKWKKQIEVKEFRPEQFLRKITLIAGGDR